MLGPAVAAGQIPIDVSASGRAISAPNPTGPLPPDATNNGLAATNVSVGIEAAGVPCENCVLHGGTPNVGLPFPIFAVSKGSILTVSTWFQSTSYTGPCTASFVMKQGSSIVASGSYPYPGGCMAGQLYGVFFTVPVPTTTGQTGVIGSVTGGANKSSAVTAINVQ